MGNPNRRFLSPASTALQVIEAHKRFHRGKVVVRGNALHWFIYQLHANELPLRHLIKTLDSKSTGLHEYTKVWQAS